MSLADPHSWLLTGLASAPSSGQSLAPSASSLGLPPSIYRLVRPWNPILFPQIPTAPRPHPRALQPHRSNNNCSLPGPHLITQTINAPRTRAIFQHIARLSGHDKPTDPSFSVSAADTPPTFHTLSYFKHHFYARSRWGPVSADLV